MYRRAPEFEENTLAHERPGHEVLSETIASELAAAAESGMKRNPARHPRDADSEGASASTAHPAADDVLARTPAALDSFPAHVAAIEADAHVSSGYILWTLTKDVSTAQACCWTTPTGLELDMHIWTGARVLGQEDLAWSRLFSTNEALITTAQKKKRQLQAAGWLEEIDTAVV